MPAAINLVGISSGFPNPGTYVEIDFAQGPVSGYGGVRSALLLGNGASGSSATRDTVVYGPDTPVTCQTEADVISLFGTGSQLHRMFLRFVAVNKVTPLYMVAVTESAGSAASLTETLTTAAISNGNHRTWCVDQFVDAPITSGQNVGQIAAAVVSAVNSQSRWPVTASNASGVITYTAVEAGPEGNWIRMQAQITPATATIGTTTSLTANTYLTGGTTADNVTNALATIIGGRYYYIAVGDSDSTNVGRVVTQVNSQAQPTTGIRQRVFAGSVDTLANAITVATGLNAARAEVTWGSSTDLTPAELAANNAALYSALEPGTVGVARKNYSLFPSNPTDQNSWLIPAGRNGIASAPTVAQITSALNNGLTPITVLGNGTSQLVKRCTTRSLNGANPDYRIRDAHKVSICDFWADDAQSITQTQFGGKDLLQDPKQGAPAVPNTAVTPSIWAGALKGLVTRYGNAGQWSSPIPGVYGADYINGNAIVQAETSPPTRLSALFGLTPVNIADQFCLLVQQVG